MAAAGRRAPAAAVALLLLVAALHGAEGKYRKPPRRINEFKARKRGRARRNNNPRFEPQQTGLLDISPPDGDSSDGSAPEDRLVTPLIIGGDQAPAWRWRYHCSLYGDGGRYCGGSRIGNSAVLTAAHCVANTQPTHYGGTGGESERFRVTCGPTQFSQLDPSGGPAERGYAVRHVVMHPSYETTSGFSDHDIALVFLKDCPRGREKVAVPPATDGLDPDGWIANNHTLAFFGLGNTGGNGVPNSLRFYQAQSHPDDLCSSVHGANFEPGIMFCAGPLRGGKSVYFGDSGSPVIYNTGNTGNPLKGAAADDRQVGIVSWGTNFGKRNWPNVFVRVATFREWIDETLAAHDADACQRVHAFRAADQPRRYKKFACNDRVRTIETCYATTDDHLGVAGACILDGMGSERAYKGSWMAIDFSVRHRLRGKSATIRTEGSSFNTVLRVFRVDEDFGKTRSDNTSAAFAGLEEYDCIANLDAYGFEAFTFPVPAVDAADPQGVRYYVLVAGHYSPSWAGIDCGTARVRCGTVPSGELIDSPAKAEALALPTPAEPVSEPVPEQVPEPVPEWTSCTAELNSTDDHLDCSLNEENWQSTQRPVWFKIDVAPELAGVTVRVSTEASSYDTVLRLYRLDAAYGQPEGYEPDMAGIDCLTYNDDNPPRQSGATSVVTYTLPADLGTGIRLYAAVAGFGKACGIVRVRGTII